MWSYDYTLFQHCFYGINSVLNSKEKVTQNHTREPGMTVSITASKHTDVCILNVSGPHSDYRNIMKPPAVVGPVYYP